MAAFLLSFREGLEAALIVGIVLAYLARIGEGYRSRYVWAGVATACLTSIVIGLLLFIVGVELEGQAEEIFEGVVMLLAAVMLTWMIFWMQSQNRKIKSIVEENVRRAAMGGGTWGLFLLAFLAVVREGIELALFLTAATFTSSAVETIVGASLGIVAAVAVGLVVIVGTRRLNVQNIFTLTSLLLIVVAAGLAGHGIHELGEAGIVPVLVEHIWSTKSLLNDTSIAGSLLKALVGYNDDPSLAQVLAYVGYITTVILILATRRHMPSAIERRRAGTSRPQP